MRSLLLATGLYFAVVAVTYSSDPSSAAQQAFNAFVLNRESALSNLASFQLKGTLTVTSESDPSSPGLFNFNVIGKGDKIKESDECLDNHGKITLTRVYYLTPTKIIEADSALGESQARIFTLGKVDHYGLFNSPGFMEYSFLNTSIGNSGIPALLPSVVASKETWNGVAQKVQTVAFAENGILRVQLTGKAGFSSVDFIRPSGTNSGYRVGAISYFYPQGGAIDRKVEVLKYVHDRILGDVGEAFRMSLFRDPNRATPSYVWDFKIQEMNINCPVDDDSLDFDPTSVAEIYDGDKNIYINVPR